MQQRLASVDALRGLTVAAMLVVNDPGDWGHVYAPLMHATWHGCTPTDLIFPFFLFVVGVSLSLSLVPRLEADVDRAALARTVLWRSLRIVAFGLALHALAHWMLQTPHFRVMGVLQRIGLCVLATGLLVTYTRARAQWWIVALLLIVYWGALAAGGSLAPLDNLASRIDSVLLGPSAYSFDAATGRAHDPEGIPSTLTAIATTLLGVRGGAWLRAGAANKLLVAGLVAVVLGLFWSFVFPLNKNLWTSSYVLWTAGWAALSLAFLHWLIDRRGWPPLGRSLGVNAIAVYAGSAAMIYVLMGLAWLEPLYARGFASWLTPRFGPWVASLAWALAFTTFWWLVAWWLDRRRLYFKI